MYKGLKKPCNNLKFVFIYETRIKACKSNRDFSDVFESAYGYYCSKINSYIELANIKTIENNQKSKCCKAYMTKNCTKLLSFCFHLRNSISHALLEKDGTNYGIIDKSKYGNTSSYGYVPSELVDNFIKLIITEYEDGRFRKEE